MDDTGRTEGLHDTAAPRARRGSPGPAVAADGLGGGFAGAFTWSNIGLQIGNGLISGSAGFVVGRLLDRLFSDGETMQEMMQRFADEIIGRLTVEMRSIINEAFFLNDLQRLKSSTAALGEKYAAFQVTGDVPLLDAALDHSFDALEDSITLGPPALGTFVVAAGLKMCLLEEKAKTNKSFHEVTLDEVERSSALLDRFIAELLAANDRAVSQFRSCKTIPGEGLFCFITVNGVVSHQQVFDAQGDRQRIVDGLNRVTQREIIAPALEIAATWRQLDRRPPVIRPPRTPQQVPGSPDPSAPARPAAPNAPGRPVEP